jgi:hypothetical protein
VHTANADLYSPAFLATCAGVLRPGGVLAVWSADASTELQQALAAGVGPCEEVLLPVRRDRRGFTYAIYLAERLPRGG